MSKPTEGGKGGKKGPKIALNVQNNLLKGLNGKSLLFFATLP